MRWPRSRLTLYAHPSDSMSKPFITVLVLWLCFIFGSFAMSSDANRTLLSVLFFCALSAATAIYLILELGQPFDGLMQVPSAPLRHALPSLCRASAVGAVSIPGRIDDAAGLGQQQRQPVGIEGIARDAVGRPDDAQRVGQVGLAHDITGRCAGRRLRRPWPTKNLPRHLAQSSLGAGRLGEAGQASSSVMAL